jgi:hypothetical protein
LKRQIKIAKGRRSSSPFAAIEDAIAAIHAGDMVIVVDDANRENEGDLTIAAEKVTAEASTSWPVRPGPHLRVDDTRTPDELEIPLMVSQNSSRFETAFCVSIEAKGQTSTGISASDRAATVRAALIPRRGLRTWRVRGTCSRCDHGPAASWFGRGRPKPRWISRGSRVSILPA